VDPKPRTSTSKQIKHLASLIESSPERNGRKFLRALVPQYDDERQAKIKKRKLSGRKGKQGMEIRGFREEILDGSNASAPIQSPEILMFPLDGRAATCSFWSRSGQIRKN
jgi:hypothetical protein